MRKFALPMSCILLGLTAPAFAQEKPAELEGYIRAASPMGKATLHKLFFHIYDISFWSDTAGWSTPPYALSIVYGMHFTADEMANRSYTEMRHTSGLPEATLKTYIPQLRKAFHEVYEGDRLTALALSNDRLAFYFNGRQTALINAPGIGPAFLGIWLSPKSSEPQMQRALIHQS